MKVSRVSRAIAAGVAAIAIIVPAAAEAQLIRLFDPSTQQFVVYDTSRPDPRSMMPDQQYMAQVVDFPTEEAPGTIVIDTMSKFLYYVMEDGLAIRYGVGVGKEGFGWSGTVSVGAKAEWPTWTPPAEMIERRPELVAYSAGMPGGLDNPLGARALYLYDDGRDTMFRIHGTNEPWSIGYNVSSGCIRMLNDHVIELHRMVEVGAKVVVM